MNTYSKIRGDGNFIDRNAGHKKFTLTSAFYGFFPKI